MTRSYKKMFKEAQKTSSYRTEAGKLEFAMQVENILRATNSSRAALAKRLNSTRSYITKLLRGDYNYTIDKMFALADALGGRIKILIDHPAVTETKTAITELGCDPTRTQSKANLYHFDEFTLHSASANVLRPTFIPHATRVH